MRGIFIFPLAIMILALPGCLARAAVDVVTAPVRVASKAVDLATTSDMERAENNAREQRKQEEELEKLEKRYSDKREDCMDGDRNACIDARATYQNIQTLLGQMSAPPPSR